MGCFARVAVTGTEAKFIDKGQAFHKPLARHAPTRGEGGKIPITVVGAEPRVAIAPHAHIDDVAIEQLVLGARSEEHTSELQSLMRISYAVFCLKKKKTSKHI